MENIKLEYKPLNNDNLLIFDEAAKQNILQSYEKVVNLNFDDNKINNEN